MLGSPKGRRSALVYKGKKGHASSEIQIELLKKLQPLIPEGADVVLLGDGEYDTTEMMQWVEQETEWQFVVRTAHSSKIQIEEEWLVLNELEVELSRKVFSLGHHFFAISSFVHESKAFKTRDSLLGSG